MRLVTIVAWSVLAAACITSARPDDTVATAATFAGSTPASTVATVAGPDDTAAVSTSTTVPWELPADFSMEFTAHVSERLPHDRRAFTQGLALRDGLFYESTGMRGESSVRIVDPDTGEIIASQRLGDEYFGEGLEVVGDRIVQLTWQSETAFIWDAYTLEPLGTYSYEGEGWGLCAREGEFYMSNGSSALTVRDLETFEPVRTIDVRLRGEPVELLNELECTRSWIYANVWMSDDIVVIDPETGFVIATIITPLVRQQITDTEGIDVLNGIAYDPDTDLYYLTGKYWPDLFVVRLTQGG